MKKRLRKILVLMMVVLTLSSMLMSSLSNANANRVPINHANLIYRGTHAGYIRRGTINIDTDIVLYRRDGRYFPAYCINQALPGVGQVGEYTLTVDSLITNEMVWRAIINGYPYRTPAELGVANSVEAFTATKQAVFTVLYDWCPSIYSSRGSAAGDRIVAAINLIVTNARNSTARMVGPDLTIRTISEGWEIDEVSPNYLSMIYTVTAEAPMQTFQVSLSGEVPEGMFVANMENEEQTNFRRGEQFKILVPITSLVEDGGFTIGAQAEVETKPILFGRAPAGKQNYALTGFSYETGRGVLSIEYFANETKIIIVKQDSNTEIPLEGVEFELLDAEQNVVYEGLLTDEYGRIEITNLLPGRYYIRETRALPGFILYTGLIEVEIGLNEVITVVVNNEEEPEPIPEPIPQPQPQPMPEPERRLPRSGF
ncbi:MAG: SpaA isopeptide-forming pilin-related protein [Oscillospiraceae bacterium]|nr:SpaA isopeptide-forming pilin-related protein [Oscillospiraceae bacterium]